MTTLFVIIHIIVSVFLIIVVLIQGGKGAELGSTFGGGSSQTLFGARGAATFLGKLTTIMAVVFMLTSLVLTVVSFKKGSVVEKTIIPEERSIPEPAQGVKPTEKPLSKQPEEKK